jgi:hypothetical protein
MLLHAALQLAGQDTSAEVDPLLGAVMFHQWFAAAPFHPGFLYKGQQTSPLI